MSIASGGKPLLVLSYNVSHEAMTHSTSGSAGALGAQCDFVNGVSGLTKCAQNMAKYMEAMPGSMGVPGLTNFALVGLQEASAWKTLVPEAPNTLGKLTPVLNDEAEDRSKRTHKWFKVYQVSFYDPTVFTKPRVINSQQGASPHTDPLGRPFQILIFPEGVIFVNVHNAHRDDNGVLYTLDRVAKRLDEILRTVAPVGEAGPLSATELAALASYRVIMTGDFNNAADFDSPASALHWAPGVTDHRAPDAAVVGTLSWQPFATGPTASVSLEDPPVSCARGAGDWTVDAVQVDKHHWDSNRPGDFVFDSASVAKPLVPDPSTHRKLCSDHRPVVALLDPLT